MARLKWNNTKLEHYFNFLFLFEDIAWDRAMQMDKSIFSERYPTSHYGMTEQERPFVGAYMLVCPWWQVLNISLQVTTMNDWSRPSVYGEGSYPPEDSGTNIIASSTDTYPRSFVNHSKWIRIVIYFPGQFGGHSSSFWLKEGKGVL